MTVFHKIEIKGSNDYVSLMQQGYYPYFDRGRSMFYWMRKDERTVLHLSDLTNETAERICNKLCSKFKIVENTSSEVVLRMLSDDEIKPDTWVRGEVLNVYKSFRDIGRLITIEAFVESQLVGALLAVDLDGIVSAETMFHTVSNASKYCLCYLVCKYASMGYALVDVQVPHPKMHPSARLGEQTIPLREYLRLVREYSKATS